MTSTDTCLFESPLLPPRMYREMLSKFKEKSIKTTKTGLSACLSYAPELDWISKLYLLGSFLIFFPLWTNINQNFQFVGVIEQTMRLPRVQYYAVAAFSSCIPMILDLVLDARTGSKETYVVVRLLSLSSLAIYAGLFVMLSSYDGVGSYSYGDIINCLSYWQLFTVVFVIFWMLNAFDQRGVFTRHRIFSLMMLFLLYALGNIISDIYTESLQNVMVIIADACLFLVDVTVLLLSGYWILVIHRVYVSSDTKIWTSLLSFKDYSCLYLITTILLVGPVWAVLPFFLYSNHSGYPYDRSSSADFICANFVLRAFMAILRYNTHPKHFEAHRSLAPFFRVA